MMKAIIIVAILVSFSIPAGNYIILYCPWRYWYTIHYQVNTYIGYKKAQETVGMSLYPSSVPW